MYCISYNLYKYIQRVSLLISSKKKKKGRRGEGGGFLLHRCKVEERRVRKFRESQSFFSMSVFVMCGKMAFCTQMELLIMWIGWEGSLNVVAVALCGGKQNLSPLRRSVRHSHVCKAFTSQRYTLIFIKIRYN